MSRTGTIGVAENMSEASTSLGSNIGRASNSAQARLSCGLNSVVVMVEHGLVGRVWIEPLIQDALSLVNQRAHLDHLLLNLVAQVLGLCSHLVRSPLHHLLQLFGLGLHRSVQL